MEIIKIDGDKVYCYVDETFVIFHKNQLITGADIVGAAWAAGKAINSMDVPLSPIKKDTPYHSMIIMKLLKDKEKQLLNPDN